MLVHHRQPRGFGGAHVARRDRSALYVHLAGIGCLQASQHLGEGGLARPVLADEGVDPPRRQVEAYVVERPDGAEGDAEHSAAHRRHAGGLPVRSAPSSVGD